MRARLILLAALAAPTPSAAQRGYAAEGASFDVWAQNTWLLIADREASGGRFSSRGILGRFHVRIDRNYLLDRVALPFDPWEDREWSRREDGVRFWTGSITIRELINGAHIKAGAPLGRNWSARVDLYQELTPTLDRHLLQFGFHHDGPWGLQGFIQGTLERNKANSDIEIGAGRRWGRSEVTVSLAALDAFSDVIYQVLSRGQGYADTAWNYDSHPFGLRTHLDLPIAGALRFEGNGGITTSTFLRVYPDQFPDSGFSQRENFALGSALLEARLAPELRVGAYATIVRSIMDRDPRFPGTPEEDFVLTEQSAQAGFMVLGQPLPRWVLKTWATRTWRTETRVFRQGTPTDVDYEDHNWSGQVGLSYGPASSGAYPGLRLDAALEFLRLDVGRGDGQVPVQWLTNANHASRLRLNFGWRFRRGSNLLIGYRFHFLDHWTTGRIFDGIQARFVLYW